MKEFLQYKIGDEFYLKKDPNLVIKIIGYNQNNNVDYIVKNVNNYVTDNYIDTIDGRDTFYVFSKLDYFHDTWKRTVKSKLDLLISL